MDPIGVLMKHGSTAFDGALENDMKALRIDMLV